ncbi:MAG: hypothetical protein LCH32_11005 [Bacteroidetes bacterium]|nr:hypothetical protein [Bacteroidota bacterium]
MFEPISNKINLELESLKKQLVDFITHYTKVKRVFYPGDKMLSINGDYSFETLKKETLPTKTWEACMNYTLQNH